MIFEDLACLLFIFFVVTGCSKTLFFRSEVDLLSFRESRQVRIHQKITYQLIVIIEGNKEKLVL